MYHTLYVGDTIHASVHAVTCTPHSCAGFHFDPSFSLSVEGLAAADFYTFQQHLQPGQLTWSVQDKWVQHVYTDTSTVYNVAVLRPQNGAARSVAVTAADMARPLEWLQQATAGSLGQSPAPKAAAAPPFVGVKREQQVGQLGLTGFHSCGSTATTAAVAVAEVAASEAAPAATAAAEVVRALDTCQYRNYVLYLGMGIPGGGSVSKQDLQTFFKQEVHPKFQGFTMWTATGYWNGESEATTVLEVTGTDSSMAEDVGTIAAAYKRMFKQEAVLVKQHACPAVAFV